MCEHWLLLLQLHILSDMNSSQHLFLKCLSQTQKEKHTSVQLAYILLKSNKETLHLQVYAWCIKPNAQ
jgi:hypothetical protein